MTGMPACPMMGARLLRAILPSLRLREVCLMRDDECAIVHLTLGPLPGGMPACLGFRTGLRFALWASGG